MTLVLRLLINAIALLAVAYIVPGVHVSSFVSAIVVALVLGVVNAVLRPVLFLLSLPLEILTLGLFTFVINGALFLLVANFHIGLSVDGLGAGIIGAIALSIVSFALSLVLGAIEAA
jgi:putative membrane protein